MRFEQLSSSALPSLGFSCLNFLSNQTEICIHISLSLTSGSVFFCFCWVQFRWMNAWLDCKSFSTHLQVEQGRIWGESKPSEHQRLSQNQSQMQAIVSHFSQFLPFSLHCLVPEKMNLILYQFIYLHFSKHQGTWHPTYQATWHPKLGDVAYRIQKQQEITVSNEKISKKKVPKFIAVGAISPGPTAHIH